MDRVKIQSIVYKALDKINEGLPVPERLAKSPDTCLFGDKGPLDSLAVINLIVALEKALREESGTFIALAQKRPGESALSPFATVDSLIRHIDILFKGNTGG